MKLLGYEFRKIKAAPEIVSKPQITNAAPQGHMTAWFNDYVMRKVSGEFYEVLREGIPIIDSAIRRLISLNGTIKIIGDNPKIVKELEDFCLNVPVNDTQKGIHAFLENASNETFEQGFSLSEFIATSDMKDIAGLRVADSKHIIYRRNAEGKAEPWYRYPGSQPLTTLSLPGTLIDRIINATYGQVVSVIGAQEEKLNPENKIYFSINNENGNPYGVSIMRSMEFCAQILVTIENSFKHVFERFGDPSFHLHYKSNKTGQQDNLESRRTALQNDWNTVIGAKRAGKSADLVTAGSQDSEVQIKVIGSDNQIITADVPLKQVTEQLIGRTGLAAWTLGRYWSSTERMATLEVEMMLQDAKIRQLAMMPEFVRLFSIYLTIRGYKWKAITTSPDKPGDWGIMFETPNLRDLLALANANFLNAQADMMKSGVGATAQTNVNVGQATVEVAGHKFPMVIGHKGCKELHRPVSWPELDKVEADYEAELKYDWSELQEKVFTILKLDVGARSSRPAIQKQDIPDIESFTFSEDQRRQVMQSMESYIGQYDLSDTNSAVRLYYGQSYSAGLIQAAYLIGKDRPILDIIKNREIYDELSRTGFELLKDSATRAIVDKIIPEMEAHMTAGSNPRDVARKLGRLFEDQNSDWERLARSEMSMAAERAKLDEWKEWKVKQVEFTPAPDACPTCFAVKGVYPIGKCPLPVLNTHPRCRCSTRPAESET